MASAKDFFQRLTSFIHNKDNEVSIYNNLSHKDIIRQFYPEVYTTLPQAQKVELCRAFMKEICEDLGLKRKYTLNIEDTSQKEVNYGGYYNNCQITMTTTSMADPAFLYSLIAHELKHAQQDEIASGIIKSDKETKLTFKANSGHTKIETSPYQYKGQIIPSMKNNASLYISIPPEERKTLYDRTDEVNLIYEMQPKEAGAYAYGSIYFNKYFEQREKDGLMTPEEKRRLEWSNGTYQRGVDELHKLYPEVKNFEEEIKNIITNMYLESNGKKGVYPVTSAGLNFAVRFNAMQNYIPNNQPEQKLIDPRRIIDQQQFAKHQTQQFNNTIKEQSHQQYQTEYETIKEYVEEPAEITKNTVSIEDFVMSGGMPTTTVNTDFNQEETQGKYSSWSEQSLNLALEPFVFNAMTVTSRKEMLQEFTNRCKNELGLKGDIKVDIDAYFHLRQDGQYGGTIYFNPIAMNSLELCKNIAYQLQKMQQQEIKDGVQPECYAGQKQNYRIQGLGTQILSTPQYMYNTPNGNRYKIESTTQYAPCVIRKPSELELKTTNYSDRSNNLLYMHKLQPIERDASLYAERKVNAIITQLTQKQNGQLDPDVSKMVNDLNKDSYWLARQAVVSLTNTTNIERDIDTIVANMYHQIVNDGKTEQVTSKDLEFTYMWNTVQGQIGRSVIDPRTAYDQNEKIERNTIINGGDVGKTIDKDGYDSNSYEPDKLEKEVVQTVYPVYTGTSEKTLDLNEKTEELDKPQSGIEKTQELDEKETTPFNASDMNNIISETAFSIDSEIEAITNDEAQQEFILNNDEEDISL